MSYQFIKTIKRHSSNPNDQTLAKIAEMIHDPLKRVNLRTRNHLPLRLACENGDIPLVKLLLDNGASARFDGDKPLGLACKHGHLEIAQLLIGGSGANVRAKGGKFLKSAAKNGHADIVEMLLEHGIRFDAKALNSAISKGHLAVVRHLAKRTKNPATPKAVCKAISADAVDVVKLLLDSGLIAPRHYIHTMMASISARNIDIIRILLDRGADFSQLNYGYCAAQPIFYDREIVTLLMDNCPSEKLTQQLAENELRMAVSCDYDGDLRHLLCKVRFVNHAVIQHVCRKSPIASILQLLDIEMPESGLEVGLKAACMASRYDVVKILIQRGAKLPEFYWPDHLIALMMYDDMKMLAFAIEHGLKLGARVLASLLNEHPKVIDLLLERKYRFLHDNGCEIFREACKYNQERVVRPLLQYDPTMARFWSKRYSARITELFHVYGDEHTLAELRSRLTDNKLEQFEAAKPSKPPKSAN